MDIAIAIFDLSKAGGQERHAIRLAQTLIERGHEATLYSTKADPIAGAVPTRIVSQRGHSNHARMSAFGTDLPRAHGGRHDLVVGFQKLPGLDALFCGDWCFADRKVAAWKRLLPRYRTMIRLEAACFGENSSTFLMLLSDPQAEAYRRAWSTQPKRVVVLPPTLDSRRIIEPGTDEARADWRRRLGVSADTIVWFWLGLQPHVKGLDRAIDALAASPSAHLVAAGINSSNRLVAQELKRAEALGCLGRLSLVGRLEASQLGDFFRFSDLLVHPARLDVTGTVIVEALGAGLPVVATENCGYSIHVRDSGAGAVVAADAAPGTIAEAAAAGPDLRRIWSARAHDYVSRTDLTSGVRRAAEEIERLVAERKVTK